MTSGVHPDHLYSLPIVGGCSLDPSKTLIAYVATSPDETSNGYRGRIKVVRLADGEVRELTHGTARDGAPQWSADGSSLFFSSDRGGSTQLWQIYLGGGEPKPLPEVPGNVSEFAVAPQGAHIAVITTPTTQRDEIASRGWRRITRLRYKADGPGFLDDMPQLWLIDIAAGTAAAITRGEGTVGAPAWDPAGQTIAFTGEHDPDADSLWRRELWCASTTDAWRPRKVFQLGAALEGPAWSLDGARVAFSGIRDARSGAGLKNVRLYTIDRNGGNPTCVTPIEDWTCGNFILTDVGAVGGVARPIWVSKDEVAVLGSHRGAAMVYLVDGKGRAKALTPPRMSVTDFDCLDRARVVYCASDLVTPGELYLASGSDVTQLTHETQAWCENVKVGPTTHFRVTTRDGDIDAWHLASHAPDPRPCILQIHGGPHFAYGNAYVFEFALLAAAGFDVVYCNPRGSQTYGEAFAAAIKGDWARPAFTDCMGVLDAAIDRFGLDRQRLGIAGGSYGGYLTGFAITHTRRFAAAIAMRPASNLTSLWGTSEVGRMLADDFGGRPADVPDVYERDSVLTYADAIETPLLIIHSEKDYRTPTEQSEQLFTALRQRGAAVEVMRFLETDHNLSRSGPPRQRVARLEAILEWFTRYVAGAEV